GHRGYPFRGSVVTESKGTTVVAGLIHKGPTVSYRYTTLVDATDQFSVDSEAESAFSQKDLQEIENEVKAQNEKINEAKADSNLEMKVAGDSVTFWEKGPKISSSDNDDIDPYFQEGRNGIEFHGTTVRLLMSKTTINRMGNGIAIGGIWVPEPVVSKILATAGVLGGVAPGGIYADFGIASIVTGAIMQTAIPQRVGFQ
ncbi:hypothetical protein ACUY20_10040, partial [Corynebacterium segmentosum]